MLVITFSSTFCILSSLKTCTNQFKRSTGIRQQKMRKLRLLLAAMYESLIELLYAWITDSFEILKRLGKSNIHRFISDNSHHPQYSSSEFIQILVFRDNTIVININKIHSSRLLLFTGNKRSPYRQQQYSFSMRDPHRSSVLCYTGCTANKQ